MLSWGELAFILGLSPRVRGKLAQGINRWKRDGSIPARAGEAVWAALRQYRGRVYPRACGGSSRTASRI